MNKIRILALLLNICVFHTAIAETTFIVSKTYQWKKSSLTASIQFLSNLETALIRYGFVEDHTSVHQSIGSSVFENTQEKQYILKRSKDISALTTVGPSPEFIVSLDISITQPNPIPTFLTSLPEQILSVIKHDIEKTEQGAAANP
jgi:hypothetical protein